MLGRFFTPADDRVRGGSPSAVLSYGCWQTRFGGDPNIVGRTIRLNGLAHGPGSRKQRLPRNRAVLLAGNLGADVDATQDRGLFVAR